MSLRWIVAWFGFRWQRVCRWLHGMQPTQRAHGRKSRAASAYDCIRCVLFQRCIRIGYSALEVFQYSSGASPYSAARSQSAPLAFGNERNARDGQRNAFDRNEAEEQNSAARFRADRTLNSVHRKLHFQANQCSLLYACSWSQGTSSIILFIFISFGYSWAIGFFRIQYFIV